MYGKVFLAVILLAGISLPLRAQGALVKELKQVGPLVTRTVVSAGALSRVRIPNMRIGREALRLHMSPVGVGDYQRMARRSAFLSRVLPTALVPRSYAAEPFPGYILSFPDLGFNIEKEAMDFQAAFGPNKTFRAGFVSSFEEVRRVSFEPVKNGTDARTALESAERQAALNKTGFFYVAVEGNAFRPKDVLIYREKGAGWYSLNKSKSAVFSQEQRDIIEGFKEDNVYWDKLMEQQGVVVRPDNYEDPVSLQISLDGSNWQQYDVDTPLGANLWDAWAEGFYISYDRNAHTARFAEAKGMPEFSTVELVYQSRAARQAGIAMTENNGQAVFTLSPEEVPNLFMRTENGQAEFSSGAVLTVDEYFPMDPVKFMQELRQIAREAGDFQKVVLLEEKARLGDFYEVTDCIEIMSR